MFINGKSLLKAAPIKNMFSQKMKFKGTSYGLSEAGYDIRIKQQVHFFNSAYASYGKRAVVTDMETGKAETFDGNFVLASAIERFQMPKILYATIADKSTWARQGLSVFNTIVEPGWNGFLTLELVYHGNGNLMIPAGTGIAQALFGLLSDEGDYGDGKYQNAENRPQHAIS